MKLERKVLFNKYYNGTLIASGSTYTVTLENTGTDDLTKYSDIYVYIPSLNNQNIPYNEPFEFTMGVVKDGATSYLDITAAYTGTAINTTPYRTENIIVKIKDIKLNAVMEISDNDGNKRYISTYNSGLFPRSFDIPIVKIKYIKSYFGNLYPNLTDLTTIDYNHLDTFPLTCDGASKLTTILNSENITARDSGRRLFYGCSSLEEIPNIERYFRTGSTSFNMYCMFYECSKLKTPIKTGKLKVTTANFAFYKCAALTSLDISNLDFSEVNAMENFAEGCTNLEITGNFNFGSKLDSVYKMLFGVKAGIKELDLSMMTTTFMGIKNCCTNTTEILHLPSGFLDDIEIGTPGLKVITCDKWSGYYSNFWIISPLLGSGEYLPQLLTFLNNAVKGSKSTLTLSKEAYDRLTQEDITNFTNKGYTLKPQS